MPPRTPDHKCEAARRGPGSRNRQAENLSGRLTERVGTDGPRVSRLGAGCSAFLRSGSAENRIQAKPATSVADPKIGFLGYRFSFDREQPGVDGRRESRAPLKGWGRNRPRSGASTERHH